MRHHPFPPVYSKDCHTLILGSFPSPASVETGFYYGHPRNRFWPVLSEIFREPLPCGNDAKTAFLLRNGIALWDVLESCEITSASDASICNPVPNDIASLLKKCRIEKILLNGGKAYSLYRRHLSNPVSVPSFRLPSTSPANAAWNTARLLDAWRVAVLPEQSNTSDHTKPD